MSTWVPRPNCLDPFVIVAGRTFPLDDDNCRLVCADALDEDGQPAAAVLMRRLDLCVCAATGHYVGLCLPRVLRVGVSGTYRILREYIPWRKKNGEYIWRPVRTMLPRRPNDEPWSHGMVPAAAFYRAWPVWQSRGLHGGANNHRLNPDLVPLVESLRNEPARTQPQGT